MISINTCIPLALAALSSLSRLNKMCLIEGDYQKSEKVFGLIGGLLYFRYSIMLVFQIMSANYPYVCNLTINSPVKRKLQNVLSREFF